MSASQGRTVEVVVTLKGNRQETYFITGLPNARGVSRLFMGNPQVLKVELLYTGERGATR
ncbi:hypothetical protein [Ralstonia phage RpY2]|uniref:Uncharacterized protein n=1 Tax=Ralstonia phage RpY2 TaxID=2880950 RepID=A0AC61TNJ4_9CAUD|nr:hypothetical protein [Ralstonia phage RpY2]